MSIEIPGLTQVVIPAAITVHLGSPDEVAENVTVSFLDYIKNVASSELYPTWPEEALRANVYAIVSTALNRVFTEWYRSRGYNFDITNDTRYDQAFVPNRGIFDNVAAIVDDLFDSYIVKQGRLEPLYAQFCDGRISQCPGLLQWGSVDLSEQGYTPYEILQYYYGDNIDLRTDTPLAEAYETFPGIPLQLGDNNPYVLLMQISLNTISTNYPAIPKIPSPTGTFDEPTQAAVEEFQRIFNLPVTGIIDKPTWYSIRRIYTAVTSLAELTSQGIMLSEIPQFTPTPGSEEVVPRVQAVQYFLNVLSAYYNTIPSVDISGILDTLTRTSIMEFQNTFGLPITGIVDEQTWNAMYDAVEGILETLPPTAIALPSLLWPGTVFQLGSEGPEIYILQQYLAYIGSVLEGLPPIDPDGVYGPKTEQAVRDFQNYFGIDETGVVDQYTWNRIILIYRNLRFGNSRNIGQFPGSDIGG
ncbi:MULTISPECIES: peptidoglycan-binding domain-containing protein [unclassified Sedimentibacter]|uniref:peptidoglycan-binding domain-containing protein n=1 Tax=unclassified Sedimentibacter TaxID=2649220 RepID=UPI0027DFE272|nr:peptidoglycan-binding protein [Sedimentibacter sp. MB35-C1]WMJ78898.1 peptidoglycan-binding protein [Sedimentibacter sp. MB35-C1]